MKTEVKVMMNSAHCSRIAYVINKRYAALIIKTHVNFKEFTLSLLPEPYFYD
ncbi:unnamed protein product [Brugia timori]|uniref:Uncharacterized protein n=1 Tax=Brugia timori TaxID=42155 RepID=A0A0R3QT24_9BILA|nr:unnamed protein product [Brugia timori]